MKKLLYVVLALVFAFSLVACTPAETDGGDGLIKVGIINLEAGESGYREANIADMAAIFTEANGYDATFVNKNINDDQINAAAQFITDGVEYILIAAAADTGWDNVLKDAQEAGVKVFLFDRMIKCDESLFEAALVSDMRQQGEDAVAWLLNQGLEEINVIHIQGQITSDASKGRTAPLEEAEADGKLTIVRQGTGGDFWSPDEAKKIVEAAIAAKEEFNVIYAENDGMAEGAMFALQEAGITHGVDGDVMIIGFDTNKFALQYIMRGDWNYDGQCSPFQAKQINEWIKKLEAGESLGLAAKIVYSEEKGYDKSNTTQETIDTVGLGKEKVFED